MANPTLEILLKLKDEASAQLGQLVTQCEANQKALTTLGVAFTAAGAAGIALVDSARKTNAQLAQIGLTIGASEKEMRGMVLGLTDVTFGVKSVTATLELLARAGMRNEEEIKAAAKAFDALADAIGSSAEEVANILIPALKVFGIAMPQSAEELDKFTWLVKNTTINLDEFGSVMQYVAMYGSDLGVNLDSMIGIMAALEARGITGSAATRLFRTAVNEAKDGTISLNEALGVSQEQIDSYTEKIEEASGITEEYAAAANKQYGLMDKIKQKFSELTLSAGSFLSPLEPILIAMTALGPVMLAFANATKIATAAQWALNVAMSANPVGLIILAIGGLVSALVLLRGKLRSSTDAMRDELEEQTRIYKNETDKQIGYLNSVYDEQTRSINAIREEQLAGVDEETKARIAPIEAQIDALNEGIDAAEKAQKEQDYIDREATLREAVRTAKGTEAKQAAQKELDAFLKEKSIEQDRDKMNSLRKEIDDILAAAEMQKDSINTQADNEIAAWGRVRDAKIGFVLDAWNATQIAGENELLLIKQIQSAWKGTAVKEIQFTPIPKYTEPIYNDKGEQIWPPLPVTLTETGEITPLPGLQKGGIVVHPTLAMIGEKGPEAVIPLSSAPVSTSKTEVHLHIGNFIGNEMDMRNLARIIHRYLREEVRTRAVGLTV